MDEYIEREALVHHFMTKRQYLTKDLVMDAAYEVSKFPAADVTPVVHGCNLDAEYASLFECSVCHWSDRDTYTGDTSTYNYCPNCGARMDGE